MQLFILGEKIVATFRPVGIENDACSRAHEHALRLVLCTDAFGTSHRVDDIDWVSEFDGIWACASLLHLRRNSIDSVLHKLRRALKPNGVMFVSFKLRDEEWEEEGRFFNGYDQTSFQQLIRGHPALVCESMWLSEDVRPDHKGKMWLNAILQNIRSRE